MDNMLRAPDEKSFFTKEQEVNLRKKIREVIPKVKIRKYYYVWCANCGHEKAYLNRLATCPKCKTSLHEKTYLF